MKNALHLFMWHVHSKELEVIRQTHQQLSEANKKKFEEKDECIAELEVEVQSAITDRDEMVVEAYEATTKKIWLIFRCN